MFSIIFSIFFGILLFSVIIYIVKCKNSNEIIAKNITDILIMIVFMEFSVFNAEFIAYTILLISCLFYYSIVWGKLYKERYERKKSDTIYAIIINILIIILYWMCCFR